MIEVISNWMHMNWYLWVPLFIAVLLVGLGSYMLGYSDAKHEAQKTINYLDKWANEETKRADDLEEAWAKSYKNRQ